LPKGTKVRGHLTYTEAQAGKKGDASLGLLFDSAELPGGKTIKLDGIVQAIFVPKHVVDESSDFAALSHSQSIDNRDKSGALAAPDTIGASATEKVRMDMSQAREGDLTTSTTGISGIEDAYLNLELSNQTQSSVVTARKRNLKIP